MHDVHASALSNSLLVMCVALFLIRCPQPLQPGFFHVDNHRLCSHYEQTLDIKDKQIQTNRLLPAIFCILIQYIVLSRFIVVICVLDVRKLKEKERQEQLIKERLEERKRRKNEATTVITVDLEENRTKTVVVKVAESAEIGDTTV